LPELGRILKDLLVHQDSRHLLLISAEDPSQCTYLRNLKKKTAVPVTYNNEVFDFLINMIIYQNWVSDVLMITVISQNQIFDF
jgi:hypothetical protein